MTQRITVKLLQTIFCRKINRHYALSAVFFSGDIAAGFLPTKLIQRNLIDKSHFN